MEELIGVFIYFIAVLDAKYTKKLKIFKPQMPHLK